MQQKLLYLNEEDLEDIIFFLKAYTDILGKAHNHIEDLSLKQVNTTVCYQVKRLIKKLEKEI